VNRERCLLYKIVGLSHQVPTNRKGWTGREIGGPHYFNLGISGKSEFHLLQAAMEIDLESPEEQDPINNAKSFGCGFHKYGNNGNQHKSKEISPAKVLDSFF
jgi:hypothetical protein